MAVLVEAISVVVRRDAIRAKFSGGWPEFLECVPNDTLCSDDDLARVGFMTPPDVEAFIELLEKNGLIFLRNRRTVDIAVVDQQRGLTMPTDWLEFAHLAFGESGDIVAACWLFEGPRMGAGIHMPGKGMTLATPVGWTYEDSPSANFKFVESGKMSEQRKFLRHEDGIDVYLDLSTGKEVFIVRSANGRHQLF